MYHITQYRKNEMSKTNYTKEEIQFLIGNYSNQGPKYCSEKLLKSISSIRHKSSYLKLKLKKENYRKNWIYKVDFNQFINPNNPIVIYILGLLWADGYVENKYQHSGISLSTTYPDAEHFISIFLKTGKWKNYSWQPKSRTKNGKCKLACRIHTNNKPLSDFLVKNDYKSKSYESADKILSIIPDNLKHYWFRGLLDGDGYIHTDNKGSHGISFSSGINQNWNYLENMCNKLDLKYNISKITSKNSHSQSKFSIYGMYKTIKFCEFIYNGYPNDNIGLQRKYDKFLQLKNTENKNRYKGISQLKNSSKWRAYTSGAMQLKPKHLGIFITKQEALDAVELYYLNNKKLFIN